MNSYVVKIGSRIFNIKEKCKKRVRLKIIEKRCAEVVDTAKRLESEVQRHRMLM